MAASTAARNSALVAVSVSLEKMSVNVAAPARGSSRSMSRDARPDSDLDLAIELDESRETPLTVLVVNRAQWQQELSALTGLVVRDLYLWDDRPVSGPVKEVYWRGMNNLDPLRINAKKTAQGVRLLALVRKASGRIGRVYLNSRGSRIFS